MGKSQLRISYLEKRKELPLDLIDEFSLKIANQTLVLPIWNRTYYHLFLTISEKKEVNTQFILHILQGREKSVVISKSNFSTNTLQHFLLQENTVLKPSAYGIPEPQNGLEISVDKLDVVFVPLLAFDLNGNRVGYGKGFYDRFLATCQEDAIFIGLSFFEAEKQIEVSNDDVPLHYCVTPEQVYDFRK